MKIKIYKSRISKKSYSNWKVKRFTREEIDRELEKKGLKVKNKKLSGEEKSIKEYSEEAVVGYCRIRNFKNIILKMKTERELFSDYLNQFIKAITEIVEMEGGETNRFSEDGILFYFKKGKHKKDYLTRAVLSSFRMRYRMNKLNRKWKTIRDDAWTIGVGIDMGTAYFKTFENSSTLTGELANMVIGLSNSAGNGQILISDKIFNDVDFDKSLFQIKEARHVPVHGKGYVLKVREVIGVNKDVGLV